MSKKINIENKIKQKAQELKEKYQEFMEVQDSFYSIYDAEFEDTKKLDSLIYQGIQIEYKQQEYFKSLAELINDTDFKGEGAE